MGGIFIAVFFIGRVIGFWGRTGICGFMCFPSFCGFFFFVDEGEVGGEKGGYGVHTVGGIFLLTAFSVTEVVRF